MHTIQERMRAKSCMPNHAYQIQAGCIGQAVTPAHVYTGFGLVHGSVTLKQEDFPQLKFPLALRCEWTNSNGCVPFDCYINGMPNDLECWQSCPDPCFSVKRCDTFSKECTCQGFSVDLTYVAPTTTTTTTPAPTTTTSTPAPTTAENELPGTTPVDDHLQTCPCEAPAINPVPADKSCRDHVTRSPCKESYYKRKDDPPPPLICNWHQVTGCIPWECYSTPGAVTPPYRDTAVSFSCPHRSCVLLCFDSLHHLAGARGYGLLECVHGPVHAQEVLHRPA